MFLDIATGILLSIGANWYFGTELTFWLILLGVVFVLFPDIDFLIEMVRHGNVGGKVIREHREITHFPLIYVPLIVSDGELNGFGHFLKKLINFFPRKMASFLKD